MAYRVELTPRAERDLDELYRWVTEKAPFRGPRWFDRLEATILSLAIFPERCPAVEGLSTSDGTVRQLTFGRKAGRYVVYYAILSDAVRILHVRHSARKMPERTDLFG